MIELGAFAFIDKSIVPESVSDMKLIHGGRVLENEKTLAESGVHVGDLTDGVITMHVVVQFLNANRRTGTYLLPNLTFICFTAMPLGVCVICPYSCEVAHTKC